LSAAYRHGKYAASAVDIAGASAARYAGDWYLRLRGTAAFQSGSHGLSFSVLARRIGGDPDDLTELHSGLGEDIVTLGPGSIDLAPTAFVAARWQRRLTRRFGCSATASWNRQEGIPNRAGLTVGVFTRW
jgi:YaiO family outer membrane protein